MSRSIWRLLALLLFAFGYPSVGLPQRITLLHTSDVHGHIYPFDYFRGRPADIGLAKVAALVEAVRQEGHPVVLLSGMKP